MTLLTQGVNEVHTKFLWLEVTGKCQLTCTHCYNDSGPAGTHGTMSPEDWERVITDAAALGVEMVQLIGGEPTLHPELARLIRHAVAEGLKVEVYSNLVHVSDDLWEAFGLPGVSLATSYYSDDSGQHARITGRPTLERTEANIAEALRRGIPLRTGIIDVMEGQRTDQAAARLRDLGVIEIGTDKVRALGRAGAGAPDPAQLCGNCGHGVACVLPDGRVSACPMSRWASAGNVHEGLSAVLERVPEMASASLGVSGPPSWPCVPDSYCNPTCTPGACSPTIGTGGCQGPDLGR